MGKMVQKTELDLLYYEIEHGTQRSVGLMYATMIGRFSSEPMKNDTLCAEVNRKIRERWSFSGLESVKKIAWKIHADMTDGEADA